MISSCEKVQSRIPFLTANRAGWLVLILTTLYACYFSHLGAIGLVGPDEPRYAWVARAMAESGDWITPRLYGKAWFEKPVLYYWSAALTFKFFGVSEAAARLPSALCALLATLTLAWLAWRIYGAETARWLLVLLPTTVAMTGFSHAASPDMPFSGMLTMAMVAAAVLLHLVPPGKQNALWSLLWPILFGLFLGLAVLAKGPAALILCGGAVFFWALFAKGRSNAYRLLHPGAITAFCVTALPWYVLCARRNPGFLRVFIIEHNFQRYLTPEFRHVQPFWFYVPVLSAALLPWTLGFLACFLPTQRTADGFPQRSEADLLLLSFGLFPLLFFSVSQSKLPGYILPAVGPLVLFFSARFTTFLQNRSAQKRLMPILCALTLMGIAVGAQRLASQGVLGTDMIPTPYTWDVWLPLAAAAIAAAVLAILNWSAAAVSLAQAGTILAIFGLGGALIWMDGRISARGVLKMTQVQVDSIPDDMLFVNDLSRGIRYGLNFYLHREIPQWPESGNPRGFVFTSVQSQHKLIEAGYSCQHHRFPPAAILCEGPPLANSPPFR